MIQDTFRNASNCSKIYPQLQGRVHKRQFDQYQATKTLENIILDCKMDLTWIGTETQEGQ